MADVTVTLTRNVLVPKAGTRENVEVEAFDADGAPVSIDVPADVAERLERIGACQPLDKPKRGRSASRSEE